jgi:hypothetical protein
VLIVRNCKQCRKSFEQEKLKKYGGRYRRYCSDQCLRSFSLKKTNGVWNMKFTYGMTVERFAQMIIEQCGKCAVCGCQLSGVFHIDHEHVSGYSRMTLDEKFRYVRGILCGTCNRNRVASNTAETALWVYRYLSRTANSEVLPGA